ncbi:M16 family metallopeptidase [Clostridium cylindrosporum]|uniref:Zinc protease n=1 Tax=Clostridium cylindrosporum DSM 605 TaxID=1121307 RepID=A0A0J8D972_CLOCY|nr:pitrilysin family protein [Clostridium cylindrosporum]KMT22580.1 zinc protease [Clostridium cylindrosporum DSM 605]
MNKDKLKKSILKNGLKVITYEAEGNIFSLGFGVKVGSLYENEKVSGISHLIEHMLFKGTKNRNIDEFNMDLEELATEMDIYTSYDQTVLGIDVIKTKADKAMEIVADMMMNPLFDDKEFKLEKKVILEEIKMGEDDPEDIAYQGLYKEAFPSRWHNYYIAGTLKSVKATTKEEVIEHHKKYYVPNNSIMCVVSSYSHEEVLQIAERHFGDWKEGEVEAVIEEHIDIPFKKVKKHKKGISQAHVIYAFDIQNLTREESIVLTLFSEKIGSGGNSILFKELRDKRGLAYSVYSDIDFMNNLKMMYIYAGVSSENVNETCLVIDDMINYIKGEFKITEKSLSLLKERFIIDTEVTLQSSSTIVEYMMQGEIEYNNPLEYLEVLKVMNEVSTKELEEIASKVFNNPLIYILMPKE